VTLALCGSWDHPGPCRWPHETVAEWDERRRKVRVVFTAEAEDEMHLLALIEQALACGECTGPDGKLSRWEATGHGAGVLGESEEVLGAGFCGSRAESAARKWRAASGYADCSGACRPAVAEYFAGSLTHPGKNGITAVLTRQRGEEFHNDNGFTHSSPAKHPRFTSPSERSN
jgi:hypothetical protein